ncbi:MAG: hypothetical protein ACKO0Z_17480 [Betaproteobacteria bacterium]
MSSRKFYSFNIQNGLVTTVFKYDDGRWKQDRMDHEERYVIDGVNVLRVETEHAQHEISIFSPLPGALNLYVKSGESFLAASPTHELMADVDLLDFAIGHEALEGSESATNALDHVESYEANEAHVVGESHDYSREQVDGPEDDDELGEAEHVPSGALSLDTNMSKASLESSSTQELIADDDFSGSTNGHEALEGSESATNALDHVESYEANEAHVVGESHDYSREQVDGMGIDDDAEHSVDMNDALPLVTLVSPELTETNSIATANTIRLSDVLTSLKLYLGKLEASKVDPFAWVAVDIDNDGQLTLGDVMTALKAYLGKSQAAMQAVSATKYLSVNDLHDVEGVKKLAAVDGGYVDRDHIHVKHWNKSDAQVEQVELVGVSLEHLDAYIH